jgi:hypothetical protein
VLAVSGRLLETYYLLCEFPFASGQSCCYCHLANFCGMLVIVYLFCFCFCCLAVGSFMH